MIKLDLIDVFSTSGKIRTEELDVDMTSYKTALVEYEVSRLSKVKLKFENIGEHRLRVNGSFDLELLIPCDRCLKDVKTKISCESDFEMTDELCMDKSEDDDELSFLQGHEFIVDEFINISVLMNMPSKVLCREDCKGLCPVCGGDLNETDCGCDSFVPDPRMARFADIFNAYKEV